MEQHDPQGYAAQPGVGHARTPGRGAAVATIILSFLGVAAGLFAFGAALLAGSLIASNGGAEDTPVAILVGIGAASLVYAVLLCVGAVLLVKHRLMGRQLVVAGAVVAILVAVVAMFGGSDFALREVLGPVATLVCVLLPGTREWCVEHDRPQAWEH
jgi:lysylphosphatidylglycerol synthetase-like protein (DUF2156 family)